MGTFLWPRRLTLPAWEAEFGIRRTLLKPDGSWSRRSIEDGVHLDFTMVEFVDFGALARTLLLLDAAVRDGISAEVTLPATGLTRAEQDHTEQLRRAGDPTAADARRRLARRARARGDARTFMRHVGFIDALQAPHWPHGAVRMKEASSAHDHSGTRSAQVPDGNGTEPRDAPYRLRRIFPFRWLRPMPGELLRESQFFLTAIAALNELGIARPDARLLSQIVLSELVENVAEHAGPVPALVGAILLDSETHASRRDDLLEGLGELVDLTTSTRSGILRLVVGDSGVGLVTRLGPGKESRGASSGVESVRGRALTKAEDTILYAFDKWSTSNPQPSAERHGTRGLWRVARMVRSYRGSVLVRTRDAIAGHLYGKAAHGTEIVGEELGLVPGTLIEVAILTDRRFHAPAVPWEGRPASARERRLHWVRGTIDARHGFRPADRAELEKAARLSQRDPTVAGVVMTMPLPESTQRLTSVEIQNAVHKVLDAASRVANPAALAIVFPDVDPRILDLSINGFEAENERVSQETGWASPHDPLLVLGADGRPSWCGGVPAMRQILDSLLRAGGALPMSDVQGHWRRSGTTTELWRALRDQEHLLSIEGRHLILGLTPLNVLKALEDAAFRVLADTISGNGTGVEIGPYRTPNLSIVDRWVDVDLLLEDIVGPETAMFILARRLEAKLRKRSPEPDRPTVLARSGNVASSMAARLSECLSLGGRYYTMAGELDLDDLPAGERVPPGVQVLLCTDIVSTENGVRRAAAAIAGEGADPIAIACVVDARRDRNPIRLLNRTIPVIALTEADITLDPPEVHDGEHVVNIDPILLRPHHPTPTPEPPISEATLLAWCAADPDSLRLGHVERYAHTHFSVYLNLSALLRREESRDTITRQICAAVREATASSDTAQIWFPGHKDDFAGAMAVAVRERLIAEDGAAPALMSVPRWSAGSGWTFPAKLDIPDLSDPVVIVDWGARSATTLQQMIRLAAYGGATRIVTIILLNQLGEQETEAVSMLRGVAAGPTATDVVPASVRFLSTISIAGHPAHSCAICETRERYRLDPKTVPRRLYDHAEQVRRLLEPQSRRDVLRGAPADLFTVPVSGDEMVDYLRWRGLFHRALRDTPSRQEVVTRLTEVVAAEPRSGFTRNGLIRLVAAEQQWLKLPPLRFAVARDLLADICVTGLRGSETVSPWLRAQAIMVLSLTAPERLVKSLPRLFPLVLDAAVLIDQLCLDCHRLLRRPAEDSPIDVTHLRDGLIRCRDHLEDAEDSADFDEYLHVIKELIALADNRIRPRPQDTQSAWESLREDLWRAVVRHRLEADILRVRGYVEDLKDVEPVAAIVLDVRADWDNCARQIEECALVNLPALREILAGEYVFDQLGRTEQQKLLRLAESAGDGLRTVTDGLYRLSREPWRPSDARWQAMRRELLDRINWWYRLFLATHLPGDDNRALLADLIGSAPVEPGPRVADVLRAGQVAATVQDPDLVARSLVFCPGKLLDQVVRHLIENLDRHRSGDEAPRIHLTYVRPTPKTIRLLVRNTGTKPTVRSGQGLRSFHEKLRPFGGSLTYRSLTADEWSFEAVIELALWQGARNHDDDPRSHR